MTKERVICLLNAMIDKLAEDEDCERNELSPILLSIGFTEMELRHFIRPESQGDAGNGKMTFDFIIQFVSEMEADGWDNIVCCNQLKALWTAYCIVERMDVDTRRYDNDLARLWDAVISTMEIVGSSHIFADFECFGEFMCEDLI